MRAWSLQSERSSSSSMRNLLEMIMSLNTCNHVNSVSLTSSNTNHFHRKSLPSHAHFWWWVNWNSFMLIKKGSLCLAPNTYLLRLQKACQWLASVPTQPIQAFWHHLLKTLCESIKMSTWFSPRSRRDTRKWEVIFVDMWYLFSFLKNSWLRTMRKT